MRNPALKEGQIHALPREAARTTGQKNYCDDCNQCWQQGVYVHAMTLPLVVHVENKVI